MEIVIKIPKEFEEHFNSDKFEDSLQRVRFDIHKNIVGKKDILSGNYEIETLDMLTEAFLKSTLLPKGHGDLKDERVVVSILLKYAHSKEGRSFAEFLVSQIADAPTIIEKESD